MLNFSPYHSLSPNLIIGYHGCEKKVAEKIIIKGENFKPSENDYDWLGHGIYFWEANPERALSFARDLQKRGKINDPVVIGATLTLGNCIDTLNEGSLKAIKTAYDILSEKYKKANFNLPENKGGNDLLKRELDCAVINTLHQLIAENGFPPADSVRGLFLEEGGRLYPNSGFYKKSHAQICIRKPEFCIKGVFRVRH